jgi:hypothetical protein
MKILENDIFEYLQINRDAQILDWGCGEGEMLNKLKDNGFLNCNGVEINSDFTRADIVIVEDTIGFLEEKPNTFDVIFVRESAYYVSKENQSRLWAGFFCALKPEGAIVVIAFNGALKTSDWIIQKDFGIRFAFNELSLADLAQKAGFGRVEVLGIRPTNRTLIGKFLTFSLSMYRRVHTNLAYISERGFCHFNPRLFDKNIVLLARKL